MVVHFELLGSNLEMTLRDIISFLGLEVDERRLKVKTVLNMNKNDKLAGTAFPNISVHCGQ